MPSEPELISFINKFNRALIRAYTTPYPYNNGDVILQQFVEIMRFSPSHTKVLGTVASENRLRFSEIYVKKWHKEHQPMTMSTSGCGRHDYIAWLLLTYHTTYIYIYT